MNSIDIKRQSRCYPLSDVIQFKFSNFFLVQLVNTTGYHTKDKEILMRACSKLNQKDTERETFILYRSRRALIFSQLSTVMSKQGTKTPHCEMLSMKTSVKLKLLQRPISKTGSTVVFSSLSGEYYLQSKLAFKGTCSQVEALKGFIILFVQLDAQLDVFKYKYDSLRIFP